jgi:hypothetical protein
MDFKRVYIQFEANIDGVEGYNEEDGFTNIECFSMECNKSYEADEQIRQLLNDGYEIVSTAPTTATILSPSWHDESKRWSGVFTDGIEVFLVKKTRNNAN